MADANDARRDFPSGHYSRVVTTAVSPTTKPSDNTLRNSVAPFSRARNSTPKPTPRQANVNPAPATRVITPNPCGACSCGGRGDLPYREMPTSL